MEAFALPDCSTVSGININGGGKPMSPACINGFTVSYSTQMEHEIPIGQLISFNQYSAVPAGCPLKVVVSGAAFLTLQGMGTYTAADAGEKFTSYQNGAGLYMYYTNSSSSGGAGWVVGASSIGGGGNGTIFLASSTPCPPMGRSDASGAGGVQTNMTLRLPTFPPPREYEMGCCVAWRTPPSGCKQAVCDCRSLLLLGNQYTLTSQQYQNWVGLCSVKTMGTGGSYPSDDTSTSAGSLELVQDGNFISPPDFR